jgi:hypothetical protein
MIHAFATAGDLFRAQAEAERTIAGEFGRPEGQRTGPALQSRERLLAAQLTILAMDQMDPTVINPFTVRGVQADAERLAQTLILQGLADQNR